MNETIKHTGMGMEISYTPATRIQPNNKWAALWNTEPQLIIKWKERTIYAEVKGNFQQMANGLARAFATESQGLMMEAIQKRLKNARGLPPELVMRRPSPFPHYKKANYVLRWLRSEGVELNPIYHPLQRRNGYPEGPPPQEFLDMWQKDHVFRGLCLIRKSDNWMVLRAIVMESEESMLKRLPKPLRRRLAERKLSVAVANYIGSWGLGSWARNDINSILKAPKWATGSLKTLSAYQTVKWTEQYIRQYGRSPSRDFTALTRSRLPSDAKEWPNAVYSFGRAGGVVPTSFKGVRKLVSDLHNRNSMAYRMVNSQHRDEEVWVPSMPLPVLPDIGASVRILESANDYSAEGREMNHCIGMYAGMRGLFAHIERDELKASLFLSDNGSSYQCLGPCNQMNPLTRDVTDHWLPVLKEWVSPDKFVNKSPDNAPQPALPEYD